MTLEVRRAQAHELDAIVELAGAALGWNDDGPHRELFSWKHLENPAGPSPSWVALLDGQLAGFRTYLRWRWRRPDGGCVDAVRAVDTATHPDHQGKGIFRALTLGSLDELADEGVAFVFNTPNDRSRPGYLSMGWRSLGPIPISIVPRKATSVTTVLRARQPADKWSLPATVGWDAHEAFADGAAVARLLARLPPSRALATDRTPAFLAWRYGFEPLRYRVLLAGDRIEDGLIVFRLRARGPAVEATICEVLGVHDRARSIRGLLRDAPADYAIGTRSTLGSAAVPLPRMGPVLTWREVTAHRPAVRRDLDLSLGDIELL